MKLNEVLSAIHPADVQAMEAARVRWDAVAHPLHSLGLLEDAIVRIAGAQGTAAVSIGKRAVVAMCADNGVVAEGVTQSGQEITALVAENMSRNRSSVCCMAKLAGARVVPVNVGIAAQVSGHNILQKVIRRGTANLAVGPAMSRAECEAAILVGIQVVEELHRDGYSLIATGEMGIGNTTTAAAMTAVLLHRDPEEVTGRGAGLTTEGLKRKVDAIRRGIAVNQPDPSDPIDIMAKVGGLDIAGLVGVYLGGALYRIPILIDGVISAVAALTAQRLCPAAGDYMVASHISGEPAGQLLLEALGLEAPIHANMALGEGTGAVTMMPLLDMAMALYQDMCSFQEYDMDAYEHLS